MSLKRSLSVAVVALAGFGITVSSAGAVPYSAPAGMHKFTIATGGVVNCSAATYNGDANGSGVSPFVPVVSTCIGPLGLAASVFASGLPFQISLTSATAGNLVIPFGSRLTVRFPAVGCDVVVEGPQTSSGGISYLLGNVGLNVTGLSYQATGCPPQLIPASGVLSYESLSPIAIPGI